MNYGYDPSGGRISLTYSSDAEPATGGVPAVTEGFSYTPMEQLSQVTYGTSPQATFTYTYNADAQETVLTTGGSGYADFTTTTSYDALGDVTGPQTMKGSTSLLNLTYAGYDPAGNVGSEVASPERSAAKTTYFGYDAGYRITNEGSTTPPPTYFKYDGSNFETQRQPSDAQSFDQAGELTASGSGSVCLRV